MYRLKSKETLRNITLQKEQYSKIYPDKVQRRVNIHFNKAGMSKELEDKIAFYLIKHYDVDLVGEKNKVLDSEDDLDELKWNDLQILMRDYNNKVDDDKKIKIYGLNRNEITTQIRQWRKDGVKL